MKIFTAAIFVFLMYQVICDIAPFDEVGTSSSSMCPKDGSLTQQTGVQMISYAVNVITDLSTVNETYTYLLHLKGNDQINQTCIIPFNSDHDYGNEKVRISVNGEYREVLDAVAIEEEDIGLPSSVSVRTKPFWGYLVDLTFDPGVDLTIVFTATTTLDSYTESYAYLYTATTSRFWSDDLIQSGSFQLSYESETFEEFSLIVPEEIVTSGKVLSLTETNFDASQRVYEIIVDTGVTYNPSPIPGGTGAIIGIVIASVCVVCVLIILGVLGVFIFIGGKAKQMSQKSTELVPVGQGAPKKEISLGNEKDNVHNVE